MKPGDDVNIEVDVIGKYIERMLAIPQSLRQDLHVNPENLVNPSPTDSKTCAFPVNMSPVTLATIEEAVADIRDGRMIIIVDDEDRENEGDLVCAAEKVTPEIINFMARHARGLICLPLTEERCDELHLTTQVADNTSYLGTAFTVSIDARRGITTGISAADRATTIPGRRSESRPQDLCRPGHIFPCAPRTAASSFVPDRPKPASTSPASPVSILPE